LGRFVRSGLGSKCLGFSLTRLLQKPRDSFGLLLVQPPIGGLEAVLLGPVSLALLEQPLQLDPQNTPILGSPTLKVLSPVALAPTLVSGVSAASSSIGFTSPAIVPGVSSMVSPQVLHEVGSLEGRVFPSFSLEEPTSKYLIQYKRKGRKSKSAVGQGEHEDVGFLKLGFLKPSSSSHPQADRGFSGGGCSSPSRARSLNSVEWSLFCSSMGIEKGQEDNTMAYLSALDEEHRRWDKIEDCEF
jgi:hypothetical protein